MKQVTLTILTKYTLFPDLLLLAYYGCLYPRRPYAVPIL